MRMIEFLILATENDNISMTILAPCGGRYAYEIDLQINIPCVLECITITFDTGAENGENLLRYLYIADMKEYHWRMVEDAFNKYYRTIRVSPYVYHEFNNQYNAAFQIFNDIKNPESRLINSICYSGSYFSP